LRPAQTTVPETGVFPASKVNVAVLIVTGSIASLNVASISLLTGTPIASSAGSVERTVGARVSRFEPVVKVHS
jgi:hypothetical protein